MRPADPDDAGATRLPPSADGAGDRDAAGVLRRGAQGRAASTTASSSALRLLLASPQFLVRAEREPAGVAGGAGATASRDLELASRLSFFLWSSIPDDELIRLATQGQLEPAARARAAGAPHAGRSARSDALVSNFAQQLLYLRNLPATSPDGVFYPNWDDELRQSLKRESELFFDSIIREDRNVVDLLTADYTFVNERLARHYGIPNVYGSRFRRVTLPPEMDYRRGLLGKGSFLAVTWTQNFRIVAGEARRVGAGEHSRHAAARAAAERAGARGHQGRERQGADAARADDAASRQPDRAPAATRSWTRSGSRSRTSTPTRAGARGRAATAARRSTRR